MEKTPIERINVEVVARALKSLADAADATVNGQPPFSDNGAYERAKAYRLAHTLVSTLLIEGGV